LARAFGTKLAFAPPRCVGGLKSGLEVCRARGEGQSRAVTGTRGKHSAYRSPARRSGANSRSGCLASAYEARGSVAKGHRRSSNSAGQLHHVKGALGKPQQSIKQNVVEDCVVVVDADARANHGLAIAFGIPGNSELRGKVEIGIAHSVAEAREKVINGCKWRQIAIGSTGIAHVANPDCSREIGFHLPTITNIRAQTVVGAEATIRFAKALQFGEGTLPVSYDNEVSCVIQRTGSARLTSGAGQASRSVKEQTIQPGGKTKKVGESPTGDAVVANAVAKDMGTPNLGAVVFHLAIALNCRLGREEARARFKSGARQVDFDALIRER